MVTKVISTISRFLQWVAMTAIGIMMLIITIGVIGRVFDFHLLGNVELVEILQVTLIMCAFAITQAADKHIVIGIITDHLPKRVQIVIDVIGYVITIGFCFIIGYIFWEVALEDYHGIREKTLLLDFPHYILKFLTSIGFFAWGLETINRLILLVSGKFRLKTQLERELDS